MCKKTGFTLLEILVAIAVLGVLATVVVPNLWPARPRADRDAFITRLGSLVKFSWQNAIVTGKIHKVHFNFAKKEVSLFLASGKKDKSGKATFVPVKRSYIKTSIKILEQLEVKNFYVEGFDEMGRFETGRKTEEVWFFVIPEGLVQSVIINLLDKKDKVAGRSRNVSLVLNPFSAQFEVYDTFKKP